MVFLIGVVGARGGSAIGGSVDCCEDDDGVGVEFSVCHLRDLMAY